MQATIDKLRMIFAMMLVLDNGSPFQSTEIHDHKFITANGIVHHHIPPYTHYPRKYGKQALRLPKMLPLRLTLLISWPHTAILII